MSDTAPDRWLTDAPEFEDAVRAAADYHGILPELVRKDYWVTRVLQAIAGDPWLAWNGDLQYDSCHTSARHS